MRIKIKKREWISQRLLGNVDVSLDRGLSRLSHLNKIHQIPIVSLTKIRSHLTKKNSLSLSPLIPYRTLTSLRRNGSLMSSSNGEGKDSSKDIISEGRSWSKLRLSMARGRLTRFG